MAIFILVSGAWHAGWCWERVVPLLEAAGHTALAPDLLGMGEDRTDVTQVTLAGWADQIAALATAQAEKVILVGHSRGGVVISEVAERVPDRIGTLVYLTAMLVQNGESLMETFSRHPQEPGPDLMIMAQDGTSTLNPAIIESVLYNTTAPEWVARAAAKLGREPMVSFMTPVATSNDKFGAVQRVYIECTLDRTIPPALQQNMVRALPCKSVYSLPTDHSPFYSDPAGLVACLTQIAGARPVAPQVAPPLAP